jgi:hypothetical protein
LGRLVKIYGTGGAEFFADPAFFFLDVNAAVSIDTIFQGYCLGIFDIGGFTFDDSRVVGIHNFFRAFFSAGVAGDAQRFVDIARVSNQFDLEVTRPAFNRFNFTERFELDI